MIDLNSWTQEEINSLSEEELDRFQGELRALLKESDKRLTESKARLQRALEFLRR